MPTRDLPPLESLKVSKDEYRRINRRGFFAWIAGGVVTVLGLRAVFRAEADRGIPWPLRRVNEIGESAWKSQFHNGEVHTRSEAVTGVPRLNGNIGLEKVVNGDTWRMKLASPTLAEDLSISLGELQKFPQVTETFEFKCVEGWSEWMTFTGVRFTDFMSAHGMDVKSPQYAGFTSIDGEYYVAMDLKSLMHPQTLLCLSMNGEQLAPSHGFPVRLVTAVKYGVKSIKQIGSIVFTDTIPADYWAENGYGEYLGL